MKKTICLLLFAFVLLAMPAYAQEEDPRPVILILGDNSSLSHRGAPSWVDLLQDKHPEWRVVLNAKRGRIFGETVKVPKMRKGKQVGETVYAGLSEDLLGVLEATGPVNMVYLMVGTEMGREVIHKDRDEASMQTDVKAVLKTLKQHTNTKNAKIVVATPIPVKDSRLDRWSKEAFVGGEPVVKSLKDILLKTAAEESMEVVDVYQMVWDDKDGNNPARLLGSGGWYLRGWGHPGLSRMIEAELVKLSPEATNAAAYQKWQAEREEFAQLAQVLIANGGGTVRHSAALQKVELKPEAPADTDKKKKKKKKKYTGHHFVVPVDQLSGGALDVVVMAEEGKLFSIVAPNSPDKHMFPTLKLTLESGDELKLNPKVSDMKIIMEKTPDRQVPNDFFGANIGKWRPYPLLSSEAGNRTWLLMRWTMNLKPDQKVKSAELIIHDSTRGGNTQMLQNGSAGAHPNKKAGFGSAAAAVILAPDDNWSLIESTWNTKREGVKWSGGEVNKAGLKTALEALGQSVKSDKVKAAIANELSGLK